MQVKLGINAGFAINRFPEPHVWLQIVGEELGLKIGNVSPRIMRIPIASKKSGETAAY